MALIWVACVSGGCVCGWLTGGGGGGVSLGLLFRVCGFGSFGCWLMSGGPTCVFGAWP